MNENPVERLLGPVVRFFALLGGYAILGVAVFVSLEVVLRRTVGVSLQGADEYGGYALAAAASFGFAYTLLLRGHTRIELVLERLPRRAAGILDVVAMLAIAGMAVFLAWRGWTVVQESIEFQTLSGTPSQTPLWMPQAVWVAGLVMFAIYALVSALHALWLAVTANPALQDWYGAKSLEDEILEEKRSVAERAARRGTAP
ncbi:TRAP transporter small permease subunit [Meridianimarinicoccus sp. RP-17]|uniref:TRAP transporter small permease subunit n=1 Tax=Meridianimarinicoccus zhengii TaxID=2056810 RepID=UPI000DABFFF1|nr:TRAP transporter small permease [Phycocomes zhengii]